LFPSYQNLCPKCTQWSRRDAWASFMAEGGWKGLRTPNDLRF